MVSTWPFSRARIDDRRRSSLPGSGQKDPRSSGERSMDGLDRLKVVLVPPEDLHEHEIVLLRDPYLQPPEARQHSLETRLEVVRPVRDSALRKGHGETLSSGENARGSGSSSCTRVHVSMSRVPAGDTILDGGRCTPDDHDLGGCSKAASMPARKRRSSAGVYTLMSPRGASQRPRRRSEAHVHEIAPLGVPGAASSSRESQGHAPLPPRKERTARLRRRSRAIPKDAKR